MAITDRYSLQPSPPISIDGHDEETANLQLQLSPESDSGTIIGSVVRSDGTSVGFATVQLFTSNEVPFEHTNSNPSGQFSFPRVPVGSYFITASEPGLLTPVRIAISVVRNRPTNVTITMQTDPDAQKNALFGIVKSTTNDQPIVDATVEIYRVAGSTRERVGVVNTNSQGQYLFALLDDGDYLIRSSKAGFLTSESAPVTVGGRDYASVDVLLAADPDANTGTVSGIISDAATGQPLANALVALYLITNGTETIIDITKTNAGGLYLFGDLPTGTYRVKSTVQVEV